VGARSPEASKLQLLLVPWPPPIFGARELQFPCAELLSMRGILNRITAGSETKHLHSFTWEWFEGNLSPAVPGPSKVRSSSSVNMPAASACPPRRLIVNREDALMRLSAKTNGGSRARWTFVQACVLISRSDERAVSGVYTAQRSTGLARPFLHCWQTVVPDAPLLMHHVQAVVPHFSQCLKFWSSWDLPQRPHLIILPI
jgi:hypothetical protein